MRKKLIVFTSLFLLLLLSLSLTGCDNSNTVQNDQTPYIGENGNWWVGDKDLGVFAQGPQGEQGIQGSQGLPGTNGEDGKDGNTSYIGENGNWWIGTTDTGIKAQGPQGEKGDTGSTGNSISKIEKTSTEGLVDTYTITFTDGTTTTFTITNGANGEKGDKGETGSQGLPGTNGEDGKDGTSLLTGNGEPSSELGIKGDSYIDLNTWNFYIKEENGWVARGNIKGEDGKNASADHNGTEGLEFYPINDTECAVSVGKAKLLKEITIPSKYKNHTITTVIDNGFSDCSNLEKIIIPDTVTSIGAGAFSNCRSLTSITIPESVTSIGEYTFYDCANLTEIKFSDSVEIIENFAFLRCSSLASVTFGNQIKHIDNSAFEDCSNLKSVIIGTSIESIGETAFKDCAIGSDYGLAIYYKGSADEWDNVDAASNDFLVYIYSLQEPDDYNYYWYYDENENVVANMKKLPSGPVFRIAAFNDELKTWVETYYADEIDGKYYINGIPVEFVIISPTEDTYIRSLDDMLKNNKTANALNKIDMFVLEGKDIYEYVNSDYTIDITTLGDIDFSNTYQYAQDAVTDKNGSVKGVSYLCSPSAMIYRRSIMKDLLGSDDPAIVQQAVSSWEKYEELAELAKNKGYYITASPLDTFNVMTEELSSKYTDNINDFPEEVKAWMKQADDFVNKGYVLSSCPDIWGVDKSNQMYNDGQTATFFGPNWYYNYCMGTALDPDNGTFGDWGIVKGPQASSWGGSWLLAAKGGDNNAEVLATMNAFINNKEMLKKIADEKIFVNNKEVNESIANDETYEHAFLGGQNDYKILCEIADDIVYNENHTKYDDLIEEYIIIEYHRYLLGIITLQDAKTNIYREIVTAFPELNVPHN